MTAIIDYGVGNLFSLESSLSALGVKTIVTADPEKIEKAKRIILPGVGAFEDAVQKLCATGLNNVIIEQAAKGKPLLGICLGMQLLFNKSYEFGSHNGLGLIEGEICPLATDLQQSGFKHKVPHIGWNKLHFIKNNSPLLKNTCEGDFVYYVHSYYAKKCDESIVATSEYGVQITSVVQNDNIFGTQFHPEKSGKVGLAILKAFTEV